jgi:hypothetical protein
MINRGSRISSILALVVAGLAKAQQPQPQQLTPAARRAVLDSVGRAMLAYYVFPDTAKLMVASLEHRRSGGGFDTLVNPNALAAEITKELRRVHGDSHLRIVYDTAEAKRAADTTHREARDQSSRDRKANFYFSQSRILPGNIGLIEFSQFADTSTEARKTVHAAMQFVANADALILDLRENRGGSAAMAGEIGSYFVNGRVHTSDSYNRLTNRWTEGWDENRPEITGGIYLGMPITVLASRWTFSGGEALAYGLKYGRGARIVGRPTAGGAHVVRRVALGNGFVGFIPYIRGVNVVSKTDWEGTGVLPDVEADAPDALLKAQEAILADRMKSATDSQSIRAIVWAVNASRAASLEAEVSATDLFNFTGRFEEYTFSVKGNHLYSENRSRNGKMDRMLAITPTLFQIDHESQVEFLRDTKGSVSSVHILWNDGWIDTIARSQ